MTYRTPYITQLELAVENIPGWSPLDQLSALFTLAYASAHLPGDILELGSWCGRSAIALGFGAQLSGQGKVYAVDLFPEKKDWFENTDGSFSFSVEVNGSSIHAYAEQTVWAEPFYRDIAPVYEQYPGILEAFNHAINASNLSHLIIPIKGDLHHFAQVAGNGLKLRMAFIDGDHSYVAVSKDIAIVKQFLFPGGWLCFDDAFTSYDGVDQAIEQFVVKSGQFDQCQQITRKLFVARYLGE